MHEGVKNYEHDLTFAFWFSLHLEDLKMAQTLLESDKSLKQLVACAIINKKGEGEESEEEEDEGDEWQGNNSGRGSNESFQSENLSEEEKQRERNDGPSANEDRYQHEGGSEEEDNHRGRHNNL